MKKVFLSLVVAAGLVFTATSCKKSENAAEATEVATESAEAVKFTVDTATSVIEWKGSKVVSGAHNGTLKLASGEVSAKDGALEAGSFTMDMNTIEVLDLAGDPEKKGWLEGHLKGSEEEKADHFFNVSQFPEAKFEITSVTGGTIEGNLTLKGITKNVKFPATVTVSDSEVTIASETFTINRTEWNVNYGSGNVFKDLAADNVISDDIELKVLVKATK
ncbi:MAG: YceI family protein [Flavobacteriaceae bacterium]